MTTRAEHLRWSKDRALQYVDMGDIPNAFASLESDLNKHPETANHAGMTLGMMLLMGGHLTKRQEVRDFIEGFN